MQIIRTAGWGLAIIVATFAVHEAAHGLMAFGLGYDVFIRVNSGGVVLTKSDLLLSIATAQFTGRDARED